MQNNAMYCRIHTTLTFLRNTQRVRISSQYLHGEGYPFRAGDKGDARVSMFIPHIAQKVQEYTFIFNFYMRT